MRLQITGRHSGLSDKVKAYVAEKLEPLSRYDQHARFLEVVLDEDQLAKSVEVIAHLRRGAPLVVTARDEDSFAAIDMAHDKLERLLTRRKEKARDRRRGRAAAPSRSIEALDGPAAGARGRGRRRGAGGAGDEEE